MLRVRRELFETRIVIERYWKRGGLLGGVILAALVAQVSGGAPLRGFLEIHDPSTIIKCKDRYYVFGTAYGISSKSSADKVFWASGPDVFGTPPAWTTNTVPAFTGTFWAPDINYFNGQYRLYYSISSWGKQVSAIGLATTPTLDPSDPAYHWTDQGMVIQSTNGSPYNTIDPCVTLDASGNPWLTFGSYWTGIYIVQLDPATGLRVSPDSPAYRLAYNGSIEASCVFRHGGYYYLFANWGSCCAGVNSTYNIRVGRSTSITGPYLDRNGVDMVANGGTLFMQGSGKFAGPGHAGILFENGVPWLSYHYYDAGDWSGGYNAYGVAKFDLQPLSFTADQWPVFANDWSAVYHFQNDAFDENGQYYGLLLNGASIQSDPQRGRVLNLNGVNQFVRLPAGTGFARTFSAVLKWNGGGDWQRIFDFGVDTTRYVMLTPRGNTGRLRCDIRANGTTQVIEGPGPVPTGAWTHVALTLDGSRGVLYMNGAPVATNGSMTLSPVDVLSQSNYLGHSKFIADPDFNGQIASFRVYGRALSAAEIAAPKPVILEPADGQTYRPGTTIAFRGNGSDLMDLPLAPSALTWRVDYAQDGQTNTVLGPLAGVTNGAFAIPASATGGGTYRVLLTATDGSSRQATVSALLLPENPPPGWSAYYPFRVDAQDARDHFDGTLNNGASITNDATRGNVLDLSGNNQYVSLPAGAAGFRTWMGWVKWNGGNAWQRILDFGTDTTSYAMLTPSSGSGVLRFAITVNGGAGEQVIDAPGPLPIGVWTHVALTLDGTAGILYTNGIPIATNANVGLLAADVGGTSNYFGKSHWPDPYFNGRLSSVRMDSRALTPSEIVAPQIVIDRPAYGARYQPGAIISFSGSASDFYDAGIAATGLTWTVQYRNSTVTNPVYGPLSGLTNGAFVIPSTGGMTTNGLYRITLSARDTAGRSATNFVEIFPAAAPGARDWASFYPFTSGAQDASNLYSGTLNGGAYVTNDATRANVLNLGGTSQYVTLPAGASGFRTFAGWVKWNGGNAWQRILDFGRGVNDWIMLTPLDGDGRMEAAISTERNKFVKIMQAPTSLATGAWVHLALVLDGKQGILYSNGQAIAVHNGVNLLPSDIRGTSNWFGKSQYGADANFNGRLDSIRLSSRAFSPQDLFAPVPVILQPSIGVSYAGGDLISCAGDAVDYSETRLPPGAFTWSAEFWHDGVVESAWGPVSGATNGSFAISTTGPATTNAFYRVNLLVVDSAGNQASASRDITPKISQLAFDTVPSGLQLALDGQAFPTPAVVPAVAGMTRILSAPSPQNAGGTNYNFVLWSDAGAASHAITVPVTNTSYTAGYVLPALGLSGNAAQVTLAWPSWAASLRLYSATNLAPPAAWTLVTNTAAASNGLRVLTLPVSPGSGYFRLQSP